MSGRSPGRFHPDWRVTQVADVFGIDDPGFRGGARAAVGDVNGDGYGDLVVSAGFGGGPRVAVVDGRAWPGGTSATWSTTSSCSRARCGTGRTWRSGTWTGTGSRT